MTKLDYDLDDIQEYAVEPGKYRARLVKVEEGMSKAKKRMLIWHWKILSAGNTKDGEIRSWTSMQENALGNLKTHLEGLGFKGKIKTDTSRLIGRIAILIVAITTVTNDQGVDRDFSNIIDVRRAKKSKQAPVEDEYEEEDEDDGEEDYEEDDEDDWEEEEEEEEE